MNQVTMRSSYTAGWLIPDFAEKGFGTLVLE